MRVRAKTLNFGIAYEASPDAVEKQVKRAALLYPELHLSIPTRKDCELLVREFFRAYPEVPQAVAFHHEQTRQRGYSETMYGRRRYLPNIDHPSQELRSRAERQSWNLVIQGTAGDIMKAGELVVVSYAPEHRADLRIQVHDELAGLVWGMVGDEWLRVVARAMVLDQPLMPVPLKVEPKLGRTWQEAK
jgi:DNA polymerase-1